MSTADARTPPPHLTDDDLVDLVNDLLDESARERMVTHAAGCAGCEARLREMATAHERGRARAAGLPAAMAGPVAPDGSASPLRLGPGRGIQRAGVLLAAAAVLVIAGTAYLLRPAREAPAPVSEPRHAWLPSNPEVSAARRSVGQGDDTRVMAGVAAYQRRDLSAAESLLTNPVDDLALEWVRRLYLANALVALDRNAEALPLLDRRSGDLLPEPWRGEGQWTYFVALSRAGRKADADSMLRVLIRRDDDIGARARELVPGAPTGR